MTAPPMFALLPLDGNRSVTRWAYDARYGMVKKTYADGTSYTYGYDNVGNLTSRTDAKNVTTTYTYDDTNNLTGISAPGMTSVGFVYDAVNRRTSMTDALGTTSFGYSGSCPEDLHGQKISANFSLGVGLGKKVGLGLGIDGLTTVISAQWVPCTVQ